MKWFKSEIKSAIFSSFTFGLLVIIAVFSSGYVFRSMRHLYKGASIATYNVAVSSSTPVQVVDATGGLYYDLIIEAASNDYDIRIGSHTGINQTTGFKIPKGGNCSCDGRFYGSIYAVGISSGTTMDIIYWVQ